MANPIALVDLDDTVADYSFGMHLTLDKLYPASYGLFPPNLHGDGPDHIEYLRELIYDSSDWWNELSIKVEGDEIVDRLMADGYDVKFITYARLTCPNAWFGKVKWVTGFYPDNELIILSGKRDHIYGDLLFDDNVDNMTGWLDFWPLGIGVLSGIPENREYKHERCIRYENNIEQVLAFINEDRKTC